MNPGPVEEGGETVRTLINTMKESPLTLSLVIFNILFIGLVAYGTMQERAQREKVMQMLYNCTPNAGGRSGDSAPSLGFEPSQYRL